LSRGRKEFASLLNRSSNPAILQSCNPAILQSCTCRPRSASRLLWSVWCHGSPLQLQPSQCLGRIPTCDEMREGSGFFQFAWLKSGRWTTRVNIPISMAHGQASRRALPSQAFSLNAMTPNRGSDMARERPVSFAGGGLSKPDCKNTLSLLAASSGRYAADHVGASLPVLQLD
jgi:hypothetical protein